MSETVNYDVNSLLGASFDCECGRHHSTHFANFLMYPGAVDAVADTVKKLGFAKPFVVSDTNTERVAGARVKNIFDGAGIPWSAIVLKKPENSDLPADERAFGSVLMAFDKSCDIVISVGSGTINDIGRHFSFVRNMPFMLVATAPSMDGLTSASAPLIQNNMKITFDSQAPLALICDLDILCQAPDRMLSAGVGDILGKYNALADWQLSRIINDEYFCPTIAGIMNTAVDKTLSAADRILQRDPADVATVTEGLVLSGMAMDFSGNSRPASGAEHHLSHFFEMMFLFDGRPAVLHGTKVGIGTVLALRMYRAIAEMEKPDFAAIKAGIAGRPSFENWEQNVRRVYRDGAETVVALEKKSGKNDPEQLAHRLDIIESKWDEIVALARSLPSETEIISALQRMNAPWLASQVGVSREYVHNAVRFAKELRNRYTVMQLLWDLGMLDDMADLLVKEYCVE